MAVQHFILHINVYFNVREHLNIIQLFSLFQKLNISHIKKKKIMLMEMGDWGCPDNFTL